MPPWFIDIESATEMEAKSNGIPPASRTPWHASRANAPSSALQGVTRPSVEATPTKGLSRSLFETPKARRNARWGARSGPATVVREGSFFRFRADLFDAGAAGEAAARDRGLRHRVHDLLQLLVRRERDLPFRAPLHRIPHLLRAHADAGQQVRSRHGLRA